MLDRATADTWTDDRIKQLTALLADGLSSSQIAAEMGCFNHCGDGGRSAVIGKVHRLGLDRPVKKAPRYFTGLSREEKARRQRDRRLLRTIKVGAPEHGAPHLAERKLPPPDIDLQQCNDAIPPEQRCDLLDLDDTKCHFPVGDPCEPGFFFCGGRANYGPYCGQHSRICHAPPAVRRDRRAVPT